MTLDLQTVYVFAIVLQLGVVVSRVCVQIHSKTYPGFAQWTFASIIQVIGFSLLSVRDPGHPDAITALALAALFMVWPLHLDGLLRFLMPEKLALRGANLIATAVFIASYEAAYWAGGGKSTLLTIQASGLLAFSLASMTLCGWVLAQGRYTALWLLMTCVAAAIAHHGTRLIGAVTDGALHDVMMSDLGFAWFGIKATLLSILVAVAQICLNAQRVTQDLERKTQELEKIASIDVLTGLMTRRRFIEEGAVALDFARRHGRPICFLMCDLDHFKSVNDRFGHGVGDQVLSAAGSLLRDVHRAGDRAVRLGGEEFGLLLAETDLRSATVAAERVRLAVEAMPPFEHGPERVTISIGVAAFDPATDDLTALIARADRALYRAKDAGRNRWSAADV